jgi:hypothetical protein
MAELVEDLTRIQGILWAARMNAGGDHWHLDLAAAQDSLRAAIGLVDECAPARVTADEHG